MKKEQWELVKATIEGKNTQIPVGAIVDSVWNPGYCGKGFIDYYTQEKTWFDCNEKYHTDFPDILFLTDWWVEYGMSNEPSGFGCRIDFYDDTMPTQSAIIDSYEDADAIRRIAPPNPKKNGFMPLVLNLQRYYRPLIEDRGEKVYTVCARGPLTHASHLMGLTEFLMLAKLDPDTAHALLKTTTQCAIDWTEAQLEAVGTAEAVMLLDDVTGFFGDADYLELAHPYLKKYFDYFGSLLHFFHNDKDNDVFLPHLEDLKVDLINTSFKYDLAHIRNLTGKSVTILGNHPPMETLAGDPAVITAKAKEDIKKYIEVNGSHHGLMMSLGGGIPMGTQKPQLDAIVRAAAEISATL